MVLKNTERAQDIRGTCAQHAAARKKILAMLCFCLLLLQSACLRDNSIVNNACWACRHCSDTVHVKWHSANETSEHTCRHAGVKPRGILPSLKVWLDHSHCALCDKKHSQDTAYVCRHAAWHSIQTTSARPRSGRHALHTNQELNKNRNCTLLHVTIFQCV